MVQLLEDEAIVEAILQLADDTPGGSPGPEIGAPNLQLEEDLPTASFCRKERTNRLPGTDNLSIKVPGMPGTVGERQIQTNRPWKT